MGVRGGGPVKGQPWVGLSAVWRQDGASETRRRGVSLEQTVLK